jgi:hypothetical protein
MEACKTCLCDQKPWQRVLVIRYDYVVSLGILLIVSYHIYTQMYIQVYMSNRCGHDRMVHVVGFTTTHAISAYHH